MAGKIKLKRKRSHIAWAERFFEWFPNAYHAIVSWLRSIFLQISGGEAKRQADSTHKQHGLVLKGSRLHCPACGMELIAGAKIVICALDSTHIVHAKCSEDLVKGKCPRDGGSLQAQEPEPRARRAQPSG
jgi:hypothetical protein